MSIVRALNCRPRIDAFCNAHIPKSRKGDGIESDRLGPQHWLLLGQLHDVLHSFYEATLCGEGQRDHLGQWFITMDWLLNEAWTSQENFRKQMEKHPGREEFSVLAAASAACWQKVEQYYNLADASPAYYAAIALHPNHKWHWFNKKWKDDSTKSSWLEGGSTGKTGIKAIVRQLWEEEYKGKFKFTASPSTNRQQPEASRPYQRVPNDRFGSLHAHYQHDDSSSDDDYQTDNFDAFFATNHVKPKVKGIDPLEYWNSQYQTQPDLARFALDMLAIPLMSSECERVFSSAKLLVTDNRNRLKVDIIEANECLKWWFGKPADGAFWDKGEEMLREKEKAKDIAIENPPLASTPGEIEEAKEVEEVIASLRRAHEPAADDSGEEDGELIQVVDGEVVFSDVAEDEEEWYIHACDLFNP